MGVSRLVFYLLCIRLSDPWLVWSVGRGYLLGGGSAELCLCGAQYRRRALCRMVNVFSEKPMASNGTATRTLGSGSSVVCVQYIWLSIQCVFCSDYDIVAYIQHIVFRGV